MPAQAATWDGHSICAFQMNGPQMFAFTSSTLESVWSNSGNANTWVHQPLSPATGSGFRDEALVCASDGSQQGIVAYRDEDQSLWSVDRLSGWQPKLAAFRSYGKSMAMTRAYDQNRNKFVLFASDDGPDIGVYIYDDTTNPNWTYFGELSVPGGIASGKQFDMGAYTVNVGPGAVQAQVSLFVINDQGELYEWRGFLDGSENYWTNWGAPPAFGGVSDPISNASGHGPVATAAYGSIVGHPGSYSESEYFRRVTVRTNNYFVATMVRKPGELWTWTWEQVPNQPGVGPFDNLVGGLSRGCTTPGEPCVSATTIVGEHYGLIDNWWGGPTDGGSPPQYPLEVTYDSFYIGEPKVAYTWTASSIRGSIFFFESGHLKFLNLDNDYRNAAAQDLGTP